MWRRKGATGNSLLGERKRTREDTTCYLGAEPLATSISVELFVAVVFSRLARTMAYNMAGEPRAQM